MRAAASNQGHAVVVVGAGHAGTRFCEQLRARGFKGSIRLLSEEDVPPYERPPLSKHALSRGLPPDTAAIVSATQLRNLDIEVHLQSRVTSIDRKARHVLLAGGLSIPYDTLVLATGSVPRRLPVPGADHAQVHYLSRYGEARTLREALLSATEEVVVIGGGFIGLEVAASARELGRRVSVIELSSRCLERVLPERAAAKIVESHARRGVRVITGVSVEALEQRPGRTVARLSNGEALDASVVVAGIGSKPDLALAESANLEVSDGVHVDNACRTSDPSIYAIGDIALRYCPWFKETRRAESWDNAERHAVIASHAIADEEIPEESAPWFWTDQYDNNLQMFGDCGAHAQPVCRDLGGDAFIEFYLINETVCGAVLFNAGRERRHVGKIVTGRKKVCEELLADAETPLKNLAS
jgi:3-phenylpropionate/trans-cinnamate dioxygenase ferredoxin reductase subunit